MFVLALMRVVDASPDSEAPESRALQDPGGKTGELGEGRVA